MTIEKKDHAIEYELTASKAELEQKIKERINKYNWTSFLNADNVDYKEFHFEQDRIKIKRKPTSLTTFGQIDLFINESKNGRTILKFEIIPIDKLFTIGQAILIGFGIFMTIFGLFIDRSINTFLIVIAGWTVMTSFIYLRLRFERYMMRRYTELIIKDLK